MGFYHLNPTMVTGLTVVRVLNGQVIVILLLGCAGAGKTNFVKLVTGQNLLVGHTLTSGG